jgi:6-phosphogluconolactonase
MTAKVTIFANDDELAAHAAEFIVGVIGDAIRARGRAMLALCGGRTPRKTYALLAQPGVREQIDWARTYIFIGDERFVPRHDPAGNFAMLQRLLLAPVSAPQANTFAVPTQLATAGAAADAYAGTIRAAFGGTADAPRFDLMLLGLGEDGHTAALFPRAASLSVTDRLVVAGPAGVLPPHVDRITMTFPVINNARQVLFLVSGADKAAILHDVLAGQPRRAECPASFVAPASGKLYWFVDQAAASRLSPKRE